MALPHTGSSPLQPCFAGAQGSAEGLGSAQCPSSPSLPAALTIPWHHCCAHSALGTGVLQSTWLPRARASLPAVPLDRVS